MMTLATTPVPTTLAPGAAGAVAMRPARVRADSRARATRDHDDNDHQHQHDNDAKHPHPQPHTDHASVTLKAPTGTERTNDDSCAMATDRARIEQQMTTRLQSLPNKRERVERDSRRSVAFEFSTLSIGEGEEDGEDESGARVERRVDEGADPVLDPEAGDRRTRTHRRPSSERARPPEEVAGYPLPEEEEEEEEEMEEIEETEGAMGDGMDDYRLDNQRTHGLWVRGGGLGRRAEEGPYRQQALERKVEQLEKRLEMYEGLQRRAFTRRSREEEGNNESEGSSTQQLIEFFLTEMEKQQAVIAKMAASQQVLEQKLQESMQQTHKFHRQQLQRMSKFHEVMQMMEKEFVRGSMLRDEEKALAIAHQSKKTSAVRRALTEQIDDLKNESNQQRRRLEVKFEKKFVDLATENQILKAENLELKEELQKLTVATRSNKRTVRILSEEIIKLKRLGGPRAPVPPADHDEGTFEYSMIKPIEIHPEPPRGSDKKH